MVCICYFCSLGNLRFYFLMVGWQKVPQKNWRSKTWPAQLAKRNDPLKCEMWTNNLWKRLHFRWFCWCCFYFFSNKIGYVANRTKKSLMAQQCTLYWRLVKEVLNCTQQWSMVVETQVLVLKSDFWLLRVGQFSLQNKCKISFFTNKYRSLNLFFNMKTC